MFIGNVMLLPGMELRPFSVLRPVLKENSRGQEIIDKYQEVGLIQAILASAVSEERQRWKQLTHYVTHKIIMFGKADFDIIPGDIFECAGRRFYHQAIPYDVGDFGRWTIFYCSERIDAG